MFSTAISTGIRVVDRPSSSLYIRCLGGSLDPVHMTGISICMTYYLDREAIVHVHGMLILYQDMSHVDVGRMNHSKNEMKES
jgi:hypothetical protein